MYIYCFEDGSIEKHKEKPTAIDLALIADGVLQVIHCENPQNVTETGSLEDLQECEFDKEFHMPRLPF